MRGFLGLTGYYKKLVQNYGVIVQPLTSLLKKDQFHWGEEADTTFQALKRAMMTTPVLALPNFTQPLILDTNASGFGVGVVLVQHGRPIAFMNKALCPKNQAISIYEKEFLVVLMAIHRWRHYLMGHKFIIRTYQHL